MYDGFYENFCILIDTREKENKHLTSCWDKRNINYKSQKLLSGDYSFSLDGINFEYEIAIERKNSLDELCNNFTRCRDRFKREFIRAELKKTFMFLLIENATMQDIINHNYRSQMHPNALIGSLKSWKEKYNIYLVFCQRDKVAIYILETFKRYIKKYLLKDSIDNKIIDLKE
jgi:hypothetical protein